jgi:hypothetical protein
MNSIRGIMLRIQITFYFWIHKELKKYEYPVVYLIDLSIGALPPSPNSFFVFLPARLVRRGHKKGIKKSQGCDRFARKTNVRRLKSFKLSRFHRDQTEKIF